MDRQYANVIQDRSLLSLSLTLSLYNYKAYKSIWLNTCVLVYVYRYLMRIKAISRIYRKKYRGRVSVRNNMFVLLCHQSSLLYRLVIIMVGTITRIFQTTRVLFIPSYTALLNIIYMSIYTHEWCGPSSRPIPPRLIPQRPLILHRDKCSATWLVLAVTATAEALLPLYYIQYVGWLWSPIV